MALYSSGTEKYLSKEPGSLLGSALWNTLYDTGSVVPASGIYRCEGCGDEITSNKYDPFPPQNKHQHANGTPIQWRLIVQTQTKG